MRALKVTAPLSTPPAMASDIHTFDNGIKVYKHHLAPHQLARYKMQNIHDADEESLFLAALYSLRPAALVVNIGGGFGYYALLAHVRRPDVVIHCFEPHPKHVEYITANIALNGYSNDNLYIHSTAISNHTTMQEFVAMSYGSYIARTACGGAPAWARNMWVKSSRLCDILPANSHMDLLQIDIQGHEVAVLRDVCHSDSSPAASRILVSTHTADLHRVCSSILLTSGYVLHASVPRDDDDRDGLVYAEYTATSSYRRAHSR